MSQSLIGGRYEIIKRQGKGGMGTVYHARDTRLLRDVAVKLLTGAAAHEQAAFYFHREARAIAALEHPGIVPIYDYSGPEESPPYIVMPLIRGGTLTEVLGEHMPLPELVIASVGFGVASALAHAHAHGVIHRDIKPDNVMVNVATGQVLLTDFGLAKAYRQASQLGETVAGQATSLMGTPDFLAPEQVTGEESSPDSDAFSLGALMYWLAVGSSPFQHEDPLECMRRVAEVRYVPLEQARLGASAWLCELVRGCLQREPYLRTTPADVVDVLRRELAGCHRPDACENLRAFLAGELPPSAMQPTSAAHAPAAPTPLQRERPVASAAGTPAHRRRWSVLSAAGALVLAVLGTAGWLVWRAVSTAHVTASAPAQRAEPPSVAHSATPAHPPAAAPPAPAAPAGAPDVAAQHSPNGTRATTTDAAPSQAETRSRGPSNDVPPRPKRHAKPEAEARASRATAKVHIEVMPWGEVWLDGRRLGNTPFVHTLEATEGPHDVIVRHPTFGEQSRRVVFGRDTSLRIDLRP